MIKLHHVPGSRSFRVLWLLKELGLDPEIAHYLIGDGSMQTSEFLAISPLGRAPALEIDGKVIFESGAIVQYLCERHPDAGLAPAPGSDERAAFLEWVHFAETQAVQLQVLNLQYVFLHDKSMRSPTVLKLETLRLRKTMEVVEAALADRDTLLASGFSAADTMLGFNIEAVSRYVKMDDFPRLIAYRDRMRARPAYQAALEVNGPADAIYKKDFYEWPDG